MKIKNYDNLPTPCYYYDMEVLNNTLEALKKEADEAGFVVHYAIKANATPDTKNNRLLRVWSRLR